VGELQGGFGTISVNVSPTVTPDDLRTWTWTAISRAAKGINYYAWYPMSSGYESGGFGLNNLDGTITERAKAAGEIAAVVDRHQSLLLASRPPKAEVAIVFNPLAHFVGGRQRAAAYGGPQGEVVGIERDSLLGVHRALFPANVPLDYVHINHLSAEKLAGYKLVIFPYPLMLPESSAQVLKAYVEGGGALVAEARLAWNNEKGYASERIPGLGLWEVMGARETAIETAPGGRTAIRWTGDDIPGFAAGTVLPARWYKETLEPAGPQARVVARFNDEAPAAVMSSYGKGRTLMLGSYVSASAQSTPTPEAERFFRGLVEWAGIHVPVTVSGAPVEVRYTESGAEALVFVFNHALAPAVSEITLKRPPGRYTASTLADGRGVTLTRDSDGIALRVELPARGVQVLRVSPRPR
jgi:beta-galactosidase